MLIFKKILKWLAVVVFVIAASVVVFMSFKSPSNDRDWANDQKVLAYAEFEGDNATIRNVRNFSYTSTTDYTPNYYDTTVDISKVKKVYFIVEPFSGYRGAAHTFLSFEFPDNKFIAISVEIRKEKGESFSAVDGLFRNYEITYVIADERDAIKLRSNYRNDEVFVYPVRTSTPTGAQELFRAMLTRANTLREKPEFYNTLTNTCTTNIVSHINDILPDRVPFDPSILLPENSDRFAYDLGLLDTELSFEEARKYFNINERALLYAEHPDFSVKIREQLIK